MTPLNPFDPSELDRADAGLDEIAAELEAYAADEAPGATPAGLAERIMARLDAEPPPRRGWLALGGWPARGPFATAFAAAALLVVAVVGAVAFGELVGWVRQADVGSSPTPTVTAPPTTPSPTPSPSPTPMLTPTPTPTPVPSPSESEDDDERETPEPSESEDDDGDNSGPGGGDNSGPGGGDNSGPGGGDD